MKTVAIDFDGVIHDYRNGWEGYTIIGGEPVPGIFDEMRKLTAAEYEVVIVSSRALISSGAKAIRDWLNERGMVWGKDYADITSQKVPCVAYVDDRAITFRPGMCLFETIENFVPWMKDKPIKSAFD